MKPEHTLDKTLPIELTFSESGALCHLLLKAFMDNNNKGPKCLVDLHTRLCELNDRLMEKI